MWGRVGSDGANMGWSGVGWGRVERGDITLAGAGWNRVGWGRMGGGMGRGRGPRQPVWDVILHLDVEINKQLVLNSFPTSQIMGARGVQRVGELWRTQLQVRCSQKRHVWSDTCTSI